MKQSISKLLVGLLFVLGMIIVPGYKASATTVILPQSTGYYGTLVMTYNIDKYYYNPGETMTLTMNSQFQTCSNEVIDLYVEAKIIDPNTGVEQQKKIVVNHNKLQGDKAAIVNISNFTAPSVKGDYKIILSVSATNIKPSIFAIPFVVGTPPTTIEPPVYPDAQCSMPPLDDGQGNMLKVNVEDCCVLPGEYVNFIMENVPYFPNSVLPKVNNFNEITASDPTIYWHVNYEIKPYTNNGTSYGGVWDHFLSGNLVADVLLGKYSWQKSGGITAPLAPGSYGIKVYFVTSTEGDYAGAKEKVYTSGVNYTVSADGLCGAPDPYAPTVKVLVNGTHTPADVKSGDLVSPTWTSTYATSCQCEYFDVTGKKLGDCGSGPTYVGFNVKSTPVKIPVTKGTTFKVTCNN